MGEPKDDPHSEEYEESEHSVRREQTEIDSPADQQRAARDLNAYRAMVIQRLDILAEQNEQLLLVQANLAKATAALVRHLAGKTSGEKPETQD
jgi:hypothetical protein